MPRLIQCVPNFSEGRDADTIDAITSVIAGTPGVRLLDVSSDPDHHRTVVTFVGARSPVVAGAVAGAAVAVERIDLRRHCGAHPRMGAVDVVPFVPLGETEMEECVAAARQAGERLASELSLPVYFYEFAATRPERESLPGVRAGGFEALSQAPLRGRLAPDVGPARLHPSAGAVAVGARRPLIAFNVNLATDDVEIARGIARQIRERDGGLPGIRALGLELPSRGLVQVSINVTRPDLVPLHRILERVRLEAERLGVALAGSELVGAASLKDLIAAATFYLGMNELRPGQILDLAAGEGASPCRHATGEEKS